MPAVLLLFNFLVTPGLMAQDTLTEPVQIPEYDPDNSTHFLISTRDDWSRINDLSLRFFYVEPHSDYGTVFINSSGSDTARRTISLYNGNNDHPAKLDRSEQANVRMVFNNAHYWTVDRMSTFDPGDVTCFMIRNRSTNIILNRLHLSGFRDGVNIRGPSSPPYTENITVQNSRMDRMTPDAIDDDRIAILLSGEVWNHDRTIVNTRIVNNEIRNCNDGVLLASHPEQGYEVDYRGTTIARNHIYVDQEVYTNGNGVHDPEGRWSWTENAVDLKGGSEDPENPVCVCNNIFWGFRRTDEDGGGSGSSGSAVTGHFYVENVVIRDNLIFNSNRGIVFADPSGLPHSVENGVISGNILYNIGHSTSGGIEYGNYFYHSKNVDFTGNTMVFNDRQARWISVDNNEEDLDVTSNIIVDAYQQTGRRTATTRFADNIFYITQMTRLNDGIYFNSTETATQRDTTFVTDRFTLHPRNITLPGVIVIPTITGDGPVEQEGKEWLTVHPNPFTGTATILYVVSEPSHVTLKAFDASGMLVDDIVSRSHREGSYLVVWEPAGIPGGVYFCEMSTGSFRVVRRMILVN